MLAFLCRRSALIGWKWDTVMDNGDTNWENKNWNGWKSLERVIAKPDESKYEGVRLVVDRLLVRFSLRWNDICFL